MVTKIWDSTSNNDIIVWSTAKKIEQRPRSNIAYLVLIENLHWRSMLHVFIWIRQCKQFLKCIVCMYIYLTTSSKRFIITKHLRNVIVQNYITFANNVLLTEQLELTFISGVPPWPY